MRRWWLVIALLLSLGLNLGIFTVLASRRAGPDRLPPDRPGMAEPGANPLPRLPRLADRLGLEGEKRRQFLALQWKLFEESSRLRLQLGEAHREIKREMVREEPDRQRIERLLQESARIYLELERSLTRNILASRALLEDRQEREYLRLIGRIGIPLAPDGEGPRGRRGAPETGPAERPGPGDEGGGPPPEDARPRLEERFREREQRLRQWEERLREREERMREIQERFQQRRQDRGRFEEGGPRRMPPPFGERRPPRQGDPGFPPEGEGPPEETFPPGPTPMPPPSSPPARP